MSFLDNDLRDVRSHLNAFGERILYKGVEITAIVDYSGELRSGRGQKDVAVITVSKEDVVRPVRDDSVVLPDAGTYKVEDAAKGDANTWTITLRDNEKSGLGGRIKQ